ncbi:MAG: DUF2520 domain-containing protein [Saprospiraceae bacterium]|nr:DUF2520 domain-containing protein [Saprospiraceae bacterium]
MKIVLIGAGNVATHLGRALVEVGEEIVQVFSRSILKAGQLAEALNAPSYTNSMEGLNPNADLYLVAVHDSAIGEVAAGLGKNGIWKKLVAHTSGATPMQVFREAAPQLEHIGVFYPLQTFSKIKETDFSEIPICVDAAQKEDLEVLTALAQKISANVYGIDDAQRATLHLAAVFVNNFTNHLFAIGESIVKKGDLPFQILLPLIKETVAKLEAGSPKDMQTGPAVRHDEATISRHLQQLEGQSEVQEIYRLLTQNIMDAKR